jgi:pimeloyl-ACP methyl ester carboxylesterase
MALLPSELVACRARLPGSPGAQETQPLASLVEVAKHILEDAKRCQLGRFAVVGHSMGARIGIEMAAQAPDRITRLLVIDGSNVPEDPDAAAHRLSAEIANHGHSAWAERTVRSMHVRNLPSDRVRRLITRASETPLDVVLNYYRAMAAWDRDRFTEALDRVVCPLTVIQATSLDEDEIRRPVNECPHSRWLDTISARVPQVDIRLTPESGHFIMNEYPSRITAWISDCQLRTPTGNCPAASTPNH